MFLNYAEFQSQNLIIETTSNSFLLTSRSEETELIIYQVFSAFKTLYNHSFR